MGEGKKKCFSFRLSILRGFALEQSITVTSNVKKMSSKILKELLCSNVQSFANEMQRCKMYFITNKRLCDMRYFTLMCLKILSHPGRGFPKGVMSFGSEPRGPLLV